MKKNLIGRNDEVPILLSGENSLIDGMIDKIEIFRKDYRIGAKIFIKCRRNSNYKNVLLDLNSCTEISLLISDDLDFYNIRDIRLEKIENSNFYLSFDPFPSPEMNSEDGDIFIFEKIDAYSF